MGVHYHHNEAIPQVCIYLHLFPIRQMCYPQHNRVRDYPRKINRDTVFQGDKDLGLSHKDQKRKNANLPH